MPDKGFGVSSPDLAAAIAGLKKVGRDVNAEVVGELRDATKKIQSLAQANIGKGLYRGPTPQGMIGRSVTAKGGAVVLRSSRYPYALQAEYGETTAHVYGHPTAQAKFKRRTANPHRPPNSRDPFKNTGGYMIQPAIRKYGPQIVRDTEKVILAMYRRYLP